MVYPKNDSPLNYNSQSATWPSNQPKSARDISLQRSRKPPSNPRSGLDFSDRISVMPCHSEPGPCNRRHFSLFTPYSFTSPSFSAAQPSAPLGWSGDPRMMGTGSRPDKGPPLLKTSDSWWNFCSGIALSPIRDDRPDTVERSVPSLQKSRPGPCAPRLITEIRHCAALVAVRYLAVAVCSSPPSEIAPEGAALA